VEKENIVVEKVACVVHRYSKSYMFIQQVVQVSTTSFMVGTYRKSHTCEVRMCDKHQNHTYRSVLLDNWFGPLVFIDVNPSRSLEALEIWLILMVS
jgi:hypothetical protein